MPEHVELKPITARTAIPQRLKQTKGMNLWHQQDDEFGVPRGAFAASFEFPVANDTPEHAVELQLFIDLVNDRLKAMNCSTGAGRVCLHRQYGRPRLRAWPH